MKITVITATFNSLSTLVHCVESVASQTHPDVEHIIVDGASTDGTERFLRGKRGGTHKIISEPDSGIYDALNKGLASASGDVVGFLHADDVYADPMVLERIAASFCDPAVDAVYGDLMYVRKEDTGSVVRYWRSSRFHKAKLTRGWMPPHPTLYLRRRLYEKFGSFDLGYRIAADYEFMLRVLSRVSGLVVYIPLVLVKMRVGGVSNRSILNILRKSAEDLRALRSNKMGGIRTLALKNVSKVLQFISRPAR